MRLFLVAAFTTHLRNLTDAFLPGGSINLQLARSKKPRLRRTSPGPRSGGASKLATCFCSQPFSVFSVVKSLFCPRCDGYFTGVVCSPAHLLSYSPVLFAARAISSSYPGFVLPPKIPFCLLQAEKGCLNHFSPFQIVTLNHV